MKEKFEGYYFAWEAGQKGYHISGCALPPKDKGPYHFENCTFHPRLEETLKKEYKSSTFINCDF